MFAGNHLERDDSETSNYGRRPESPSYGTLLNQQSILILILMKRKLGLVPKTAKAPEK